MPLSLVGFFLSNQEKTTYLVHITWNFVEGSCISGNQKKRTTFIRKPDNKKGTLLLSSYAIYGRMLLTWLLFRPRAPVVVLGSKLRLPMSSSWPVFPGLDQALFPPWFSWFLGFDSKTVQRSALCRSRRELSNEYLLAKIGVDTAENEPLEVWGKIQFTIHFAPRSRCARPTRRALPRRSPPAPRCS